MLTRTLALTSTLSLLLLSVGCDNKDAEVSISDDTSADTGSPAGTDAGGDDGGGTDGGGTTDRDTSEAYTVLTDMTFLPVPAGSYEMGCTPEQTGCESDEQPAHTVELTSGFWLTETEVTQDQFLALMGYNPSGNQGCGGSCPVDQASWHEAAMVANALSELEGLATCYVCDDVECEFPADPYACVGYRIPTEAEWEYAARAGEGTQYTGSDDPDAVAWTLENTGNSPHPVKEKAANAWGFYDMSGNAWEWVHDGHEEFYYDSSPSADPPGPETDSYRVLRGGSWRWDIAAARVANRFAHGPSDRRDDFCFRLARTAH